MKFFLEMVQSNDALNFEYMYSYSRVARTADALVLGGSNGSCALAAPRFAGEAETDEPLP